MYQVLDGVRIVELGEWVFVPSASAILADWGADVIKVEHPERGDGLRGLRGWAPADLMLQLVNRGKRNAALNLATPDGREAFYRLIEQADVFMTSLLPDTLAKLGISVAELQARNPRLVCARATGWGDRGPRSGQPGYDVAQVWAAAGFAYQMHGPDLPSPPNMPSSIGDFTSGLALVGAVLAALWHRERTGEAIETSVGLYATGMWLMSQLITGAAGGHPTPEPAAARRNLGNPLVNSYRTADDRWLWLVFMQPDRWWRDLCEHLDRPELADDPRFHNFDAMRENAAELMDLLDEIFESRSLAEWREALADLEGVWTAVESPADIVTNPQAVGAGGLIDAEGAEGSIRLVASPAQFGGEPLGAVRQMPDFGADTELILVDLGYSWDDIAKMKESGAIL
jgi:crotonobetainyl-CoA:carnitine CoA-transferase CaiB-like acyl-CoA transferase